MIWAFFIVLVQVAIENNKTKFTSMKIIFLVDKIQLIHESKLIKSKGDGCKKKNNIIE